MRALAAFARLDSRGSFLRHMHTSCNTRPTAVTRKRGFCCSGALCRQFGQLRPFGLAKSQVHVLERKSILTAVQTRSIWRSRSAVPFGLSLPVLRLTGGHAHRACPTDSVKDAIASESASVYFSSGPGKLFVLFLYLDFLQQSTSYSLQPKLDTLTPLLSY